MAYNASHIPRHVSNVDRKCLWYCAKQNSKRINNYFQISKDVSVELAYAAAVLADAAVLT